MNNKNLIASLFLSLALLVAPVMQINSVNAQGAVSQPNDVSTGTNSTGQTGTTTNNNDDGFNWMWLLPFLIIPFLLLLKRDKKDTDRSEYRQEGYSGVKGGRSQRDRNEDRV